MYAVCSMRYLLLLSVLLISGVECSEVQGCNGMVRTRYPLNLSLVTLHLHSQDEVLRFSTECAPNDGYFFIPLSDLEGVEQIITIKLEAPKGWNFNSNAIAININFNTDTCALGEDIVFEFVGFSVGGNVVSYGLDTGPEGVKIDMRQGDQLVSSVKSGVNGEFLFRNILPGDYSLRGSHAEFNVTRSVLEFVVSNDAVDVGRSIQVLGYEISGNVFHEKTGIKDVQILLISAKTAVSMQTGSCLESIGKLENELKQTPMLFCVTASDEEGKFKLSSIPPGEYSLVPTYKSEKTKFHIRPELLKTGISHSNVVLDLSFQVTGFEVYGTVVNLGASKELVGIEGVRIELSRTDGTRLETRSDNFGAYHFSEIQAGYYVVTAQLIGYEFEEITAHLTPTQTEIPTLFPSKFEITGKIELKKVVVLDEFIQNTEIEFFSDRSFEVKLEKDLSFRILLPKGSYRFSPKLTDQLIGKGIVFTPESINVTVTVNPQSGFLFSQILSSISVSTHCIGPCLAFSTVLTEKSIQIQSTQVTIPNGITGTTEYRDLLMGEYSVKLEDELRCWGDREVTLTVGEESGNVDFQQEGFTLEISSTHETSLSLIHSSAKYEEKQQLKIGEAFYSTDMCRNGRKFLQI